MAQAARTAKGGGLLALLVVVLWLLFYQNLPGDLNGMSIKPFNTSALERLAKLGAIFISAGVIASRWSTSRLLLKNLNPGLLAFVVLAPLSAVWSIDSGATLLRSTTLTGIVLLCIAISLTGWHRQRFRNVAIPPVMCILIASLIFGMLYPESVLEIGEDVSLKGAWHGITFQKNQFGMTASVVTIFCAHRLLINAGGKFWSFAGVAIALGCLLLSRSSTSLLATITCVFFMVLVLRIPVIRQKFSAHVVIGLAVTIVIYELVILNLFPGVNTLLSPITSLMGKDTTFSSRSVIWNVIKEHARAAPLLGSGYGAYWQNDPTPASPSFVFMYLMYFYPTEAHNGYLEIMNDLGWVGIACLAAFVVSYIYQALQLMKYDRSQAALYLAVLFQQMVANLSESEWFSRSTICIILILGATCLSRDLMDHKLRQRQSAHRRMG